MLKFLKSLSVFAGTIIGVGIFGLPYVTLKAGFPVVLLYFLLLSGIVVLIHLIFGEICLGTKELHRLPGYAGQFLGARWKEITLMVMGLGLTGVLLAYLIVGGEFLTFFFAPYFGGNPLIYTLLFFSLGSFLIFRGTKIISQVELFLVILFFVILILFFIKAFPFINIENFKEIDFGFFTFPYGVILFSLWGSAIIPEIKEMVRGDKRLFRKVIISGILIVAIIYLFFIIICFGASGQNTSEEAISGLASALGDNIIRLGFIFGTITCFTSFLTLGLTLKKIFWYDFGLPHKPAWLITCFLPLLLFLLGFRRFIDVIGLTGAVALGAEGIIIIFLYQKFLKEKFLEKMNPLLYLLPLLFILGIIFEIFYFITK